MVPAYDHPLLWEGHASMIEETARQLPEGTKPDAVVCCVGGGGLGAGVMVGCKNVGWDDGKCTQQIYDHHTNVLSNHSIIRCNGDSWFQLLLPVSCS